MLISEQGLLTNVYGYCRFHSINVQLVADPEYKIFNVCARFPGSAHDNFIFNSSALKAEFEANQYDGWLQGMSC